MCLECQKTCNTATSSSTHSAHVECEYCRANCKVECISVANGPSFKSEMKKKTGD